MAAVSIDIVDVRPCTHLAEAPSDPGGSSTQKTNPGKSISLSSSTEAFVLQEGRLI